MASQKEIKIATYNHMFGFDGSSCLENFFAHFWLHGVGIYERGERRSDLQRTLPLLEEVDADILGISEVLGEKQENELRKFLKAKGYVSIHSQKGHQFKRHHDFVRNLVATKFQSEMRPFPVFDLPHKCGYGGGIVWIFIPEIETDIIHLHLAHPRGKIHRMFLKQLEAILETIERKFTGKRCLLFGDFNIRYRNLCRIHPEFSSLQRLSPDEPTCSMTPLFRRILHYDLDHILGTGFQLKENGIVVGKSDHALVWTKLQLASSSLLIDKNKQELY